MPGAAKPRPISWSGPTQAEPALPGLEPHLVGLEELVLAYLREPGTAALPGPITVQAGHGAGTTT
jgi:hypothetical protein